jgi:signal transduction histidine kinase
MDQKTKQRFLSILVSRGEEIVRTSAEWVYREAIDLQGKRPLEETMRLCTAAFTAYKAYVEHDDYEPMATFIRHVVEFRGEMMFRLSTPQRGMLAFKKAMLPILEEEIADAATRIEILLAIDEIYERVLFDLSDKYQDKATAHLLDLARQAKEASRAKSEFLAKMSHEIRTPLNAILGFCQLLNTAKLRSSSVEEIDEYLSTVRESARVLGTLIDNILDLAKIESGRMAVDLEEIDLERLITGVTEVCRAEALKKNIRFEYSLEASLPRYIRSDGRKLNQILMNLTGNAIKFTPPDHAVALTVSRGPNAAQGILIKVRDEGIGIPKSMHAIIFDEFEQGDQLHGRTERGVGLGLAIARRLVELLGGEISLESAPGSGSTFTVTLPLIEASAIVDARSEIDWDRVPRWPSKVVVVVDDDENSRRLLAVLLEDLGIRAYGAATGSEGVDLVARIEPSLVLLDLHLPDFDGIRVTQAIRSTPGREKTPIAMISGDARASVKADAASVGIEDYITKPVQLKELFGVLEKHLRS